MQAHSLPMTGSPREARLGEATFTQLPAGMSGGKHTTGSGREPLSFSSALSSEVGRSSEGAGKAPSADTGEQASGHRQGEAQEGDHSCHASQSASEPSSSPDTPEAAEALSSTMTPSDLSSLPDAAANPSGTSLLPEGEPTPRGDALLRVLSVQNGSPVPGLITGGKHPAHQRGLAQASASLQQVSARVSELSGQQTGQGPVVGLERVEAALQRSANRLMGELMQQPTDPAAGKATSPVKADSSGVPAERHGPSAPATERGQLAERAVAQSRPPQAGPVPSRQPETVGANPSRPQTASAPVSKRDGQPATVVRQEGAPAPAGPLKDGMSAEAKAMPATVKSHGQGAPLQASSGGDISHKDRPVPTEGPVRAETRQQREIPPMEHTGKPSIREAGTRPATEAQTQGTFKEPLQRVERRTVDVSAEQRPLPQVEPRRDLPESVREHTRAEQAAASRPFVENRMTQPDKPAPSTALPQQDPGSFTKPITQAAAAGGFQGDLEDKDNKDKRERSGPASERGERVSGPGVSSANNAVGKTPQVVLRSGAVGEVFNRMADALDKLMQKSPNRVEFSFRTEAGEEMKVLLKYNNGLLHSTFVTDSDTLRSAIRETWQHFQRQLADRGVDAGTPDFRKENGQGGNDSHRSEDGDRRDSHWQSPLAGRHSSPAAGGPSVRSNQPSAPTMDPDSRRLQAYA